MSTNKNQSAEGKNCIFCRFPFLRKALIILVILWGLVLLFSAAFYFWGNSAGRTYWYLLNSTLFYINIPVFSYALLSFVAERGLFNGIRYSLKQTQAFFFKNARNNMMDEFDAETEAELKEILKEKYLYTSPYSELTLPLLLASGLTFVVMVVFTFF